MNGIWIKRYLRVLSNFGIAFLTPFAGSGVGQSVYQDQVDLGQMLFVAFFSSSIYALLVALQEVQQYAYKN